LGKSTVFVFEKLVVCLKSASLYFFSLVKASEGEKEVAPSNKRSEIYVEIADLQRRQYDSMPSAAFIGSTEERTEYDRRAERLRVLILDLAALELEPPS
jgi:hypothetical protein